MTAPVATQHSVDQLLDLVFQDELTGLYNRRYLNNRIGRNLENASDDRPYAFLLLDIDFFKTINDTHGHTTGDRTLEAVAQLLRGTCSDETTIIRFAGDEFVCYLPDATASDAVAKAEELVAAGRSICLPVKGGLDEIRLTLSVGVACHPDDGEHWDEVLERADEALYQAKRSGRDRAAVVPTDAVALVRGDDLSQIFPCGEYIGQNQALDWLSRQFDLWRAGEEGPHVPVFGCRGGHGAGKTRFLDEFAAVVGRADLPLLRCQGTPELHGVGYGGLIDALIAHCGSLAALRDATCERLVESDRALWERFLDTSSDVASPLSAAASHRLFARILRLLGADDGLVLLVDDSEMIDESTQSCLAHLHRADESLLRCFIVAAGGSDIGQDADQFAAEPALLLDLVVPTITLHPLDEAGVSEMVAAILPTLRTDEAFCRELYRVSAGNCMYVEEALKYLIQVGRLVYERSAWQLHDPRLDDLPPNLRELVARRLACLDPEIRATLAKATVVGTDIRPELLNAVEAADAGYTLDLLDKARKLGLLEGGRLWEERDFRFQYGSVKEAVYEQIPAADRIVWHRQMAALHETLREAPGLLQLGSLHYHLLRSDQREQAQAIQERLDMFMTGASADAAVSGRPQTPLPVAKAKWPTPTPLTNDELTLALRVIHSLRATLQTARLYPPESRIVRAAYEELHTHCGRLFVFAEALDLAEADGELLINGEQAVRREDERTLLDNLRRSLLKVGLSGIAFARGITLPQIEALLGTWLAVNNLQQEPAEAWQRFGARQDIVHIDVNARTYVALEDGIASVIAGGEPTADASRPATVNGDISDVVELFQSWARRQSPANAQDLSLEDKARLVEMFAELRDQFFGAEMPPAPVAANAEQNWLDLDDFDDPPPASNLPSLAELTQSGGVEQCVADIVSGVTQREARGYQQLALLGDAAAEPLYRLLTRGDDARAGQVAGECLKALDFALAQRIAGELDHQSEPALKLRLVQHALPLVEDRATRRQILLAAAAQEAEAAACAAVAQLAADFPQDAAAALLSVLPACSAPVKIEICSTLERIGDPICVDALLVMADAWRRANTPQQIAVIAQACQTLGRFDRPDVLALLSRLIARPSRWPWRRSAPRALRKAALLALEKIGSDQARAIVAEAVNDSEAWIQIRARRFMQSASDSS